MPKNDKGTWSKNRELVGNKKYLGFSMPRFAAPSFRKRSQKKKCYRISSCSTLFSK